MHKNGIEQSYKKTLIFKTIVKDKNKERMMIRKTYSLFTTSVARGCGFDSRCATNVCMICNLNGTMVLVVPTTQETLVWEDYVCDCWV